MSDDWRVDPTGLGGVIVGALGVLAAAWQKVQVGRTTRLSKLEARVAELEAANRKLWLWCRELYDYAYRHGDGTPPPKQPEDLFPDPD
jgi:hypothetical protein